MARILIDTDVLIDFLRGKSGAKKVLESISKEDISCCSVITIAEIYAGMLPDEEEATMELLNSLEHMVIDQDIALLAGKFKRETTDRRLELDDCFIAATAIHHKAVLLTHNPKHYPHKNLDLKTAQYR